MTPRSSDINPRVDVSFLSCAYSSYSYTILVHVISAFVNEHRKRILAICREEVTADSRGTLKTTNDVIF